MSITIDDVKKYAVSHEGFDVEFKKTTGQLARGMESLCGMLNGQGGIVVFGVTDDGTIKGQDIGDKTTREIGEALSRFEPAISIQPSYIEIPESEGKCLIVLEADAQIEEDRPYQWDGRAYQRYDSVTTVMPMEKLARMLEDSRGGLKYKWERMVNCDLSMADLDERWILNAVRGGVRRGRLDASVLDEDILEILSKFQVVKKGGICNAAAVLFGKSLSDYPQCQLRLARFKGDDKSEFLDNQHIEGNIFELVDAAMSFFFKHLSLRGKVEGLERDDELEVPYKALRECCVNSLAHRAWQRESSTIGIAIYDGSIEIENAGRFPSDISPEVLAADEEVLRKHASEPQNPIIAKVMYYSGLIEKWGRGLALMYNECRRVGLPDPRIIESAGMVRVVFQRPEYGRSAVGVRPEYGRSAVGDDEATKYEPSNVKIGRLIMSLGDKTVSARELRESMGFKSKGSFNSNYLNPAIKEGAILRYNTASVDASDQKYYLSDKGMRYYYNHKK